MAQGIALPIRPKVIAAETSISTIRYTKKYQKPLSGPFFQRPKKSCIINHKEVMTMLDTVILTIPRGFYRIPKPFMFTPNAEILRGPGNYLVKCVNNPTATDKRNKVYRPRMTLMKRMTRNGTELPLKIEFSVAKMLYGNNVEELQEKDFESVVRALCKAMDEMGVVVSSDDI